MRGTSSPTSSSWASSWPCGAEATLRADAPRSSLHPQEVRMRALVLLATLLGLATTLGAQGRHPNARQGFWVGFGFGSGSVGLSCNSCDSTRVASFSGYLRAGGTLSSKVLLGGETNGWAHSEGAVNESVAYGSLVVLW